jgi:cell division GTPase FtsZ
MKTKLFGVGAAGNKASIDAIEKGAISREYVKLINSTDKDIPVEYRDISIIIGDINGAGKETKLGADMMEQSLNGGELEELLPEFLEEDDDAVVIVFGAEGGTGCGGAPVLGNYITENTGITVHQFPLMGFHADARGLGNTVNLFKQFLPQYVVHTISNAKFLSDAKGNKVAAEKMANELFVEELKVITGSVLREGSQNIDDTDHFKLINNPGYSLIEKVSIGRDIKTQEQLDDLLVKAIQNTKSIDIEQPSCKRIGVVWNINEETKNIIDYSYRAIKDVVGEPYEAYDHIQPVLDGEDQYAIIIIAGLKLPVKELQDIYTKYQEVASRVNKTQDSFYSDINKMEIEEDEFNVRTTKPGFFKNKKKSSEPNKTQTINNEQSSPKSILVNTSTGKEL